MEGDIEDVDGVLKITKIRLRYRFEILPGMREMAQRGLAIYPEKCQGYESVKGCIECSWSADMEEEVEHQPGSVDAWSG